jgi:hypothetical protein
MGSIKIVASRDLQITSGYLGHNAKNTVRNHAAQVIRPVRRTCNDRKNLFFSIVFFEKENPFLLETGQICIVLVYSPRGPPNTTPSLKHLTCARHCERAALW